MAELFKEGQIIKSASDERLFIVDKGTCLDCAFGMSKKHSKCNWNMRNRCIQGIEHTACAEIISATCIFKELKEGV